jgi:hypothetical protein
MPRKRATEPTEEDLNLTLSETPQMPSDNGRPDEWEDEPAPRTTKRPRGGSTGSSGYQSRKRGPVPRADQISVIRDEIEQGLGVIGASLMLIRPLTGLVIVNRAGPAADALALAAQRNPRLLRVLKGLASISAYGELVVIVGNVVVAAGVEAGALPVEHPLTVQIRPEIAEIQKSFAAMPQATATAQAVENGPSPQ